MRQETLSTPSLQADAGQGTLLQQHPQALQVHLRWTILSLPFAMLVTWLFTCMGGNGLVDGFGNVIGGDFAMFYVAGRMAATGQWLGLYDEPLQQQYLLALIPNLAHDTYLPYRYPPMVAIVLQPLVQLPYFLAFLLFTCISIGLWLASHRALLKHYLSRPSACARTAAFCLACAPVILQTWIDGQASACWFAVATACWLLTQHRYLISAGCVLALAACKPNVLLLWGVVLVIRYPRMLLGLIPTLLCMLGITWWLVGTDCLAAYYELGRQLAWQPWPVETPYWKVQSLLAWLQPLAGPYARGLNAAVGLTGALAVGLWWRRQALAGRESNHPTGTGQSQGDTVALCSALLINALCNPYTPVYDLSLLCLGLVACLPYFASLMDPSEVDSNTQAQENRTSKANGGGASLLNLPLRGRLAVLSLAAFLLAPVLSQSLSKATGCPLQFAPVVMLLVGLFWLGHWQRLGSSPSGRSILQDCQPSTEPRLLA